MTSALGLKRLIPDRDEGLPALSGFRSFLIVGAPSPVLYAAANVLRAIVQIVLGAHGVVVANSLEALEEQLSAMRFDQSLPLVIVSDFPSPGFLDAILTARAPIAVCADPLATVAHHAILTRDMTAVTAVRFATMGLVNIERAIISPPELSLIVLPRGELSGLIALMAELYRLPLFEQAIPQVMAHLGSLDPASESFEAYVERAFADTASARQILDARSPLENELIDFVALQYDEILERRPLRRLEWPPFALLRPEFPDRLTVGSIDLTGPARFIYYGPYFALPEGVWSADVTIEVQDCLSDNRVAIEIFAEHVLAASRTKLPDRGVYVCRIGFEIQDASKPIEVRVQLLTGAIEGLFLIRSIELTRIGDRGRARPAPPA